MSHLHASGRTARRRLRTGAFVAAALLASSTACSAGDTPDPSAPGRSGDVASPAAVQVRTEVSRVHGQLSPAEQDRFAAAAGELLSGYASAAYLHARPGPGYRGSFPGFTQDARAMALEDTAVTSDASYEGASRVEPRGAVAFLSVLAPEGRPVGATARVLLRLDVTEGRRTRELTVRGRLLLTPAKTQWRIFGYDLSTELGARTRRQQ